MYGSYLRPPTCPPLCPAALFPLSQSGTMDQSAAEQAQRTHIFNGALSHGPYIWSSRDVANACRWFRVDGPRSSANQANDGGEHGAATGPVPGPPSDGGHEFLRRLISCRGVCEPRPPRPGKRRRLSPSSNDAAGLGRPSPLKSVLLGYYQLADEGGAPSVEGGNPRGASSPVDVRNAERASARLLCDLTTTVAARRRTGAVFDAAANCLEVDGREDKDGVDTVGTGPEIDAYMVRPSTCARRAYASRLYDRLMALDGEGPVRAGGFVDKLLALARPSAEVREAVFLALLEPVRRLDGPRGTSRDGGSSERKDLAPLLSSSRVWADQVAIEDACDRACVSSVVAAVVRSAASAGPVLGRHDDGGGKTVGSAIEWWDLPQELLCAVSQAHYPIALGCLRHWIGESILAHDRLFAATGAGAADADGAGPAYRECVRRVRQFRRTSDRLGLLAAHEFRTLRGRIRDADVESTGDDEEEGRLHRRLRAWDAVHREVFGGGPC